MKLKDFFAVTVAVLIGAVAVAEEQIVETEAEGYGATRETAINAAGIEGVKKINGFLLNAVSSQETQVGRTSHAVNGDSTRTTDVAAVSEREIEEKVKGAIKGYEILSCEQTETGEWHAKVIVKVAKYKTPGLDPNSRRRLVIAPFSIMHEAYPIGEQFMPARQAASVFRDKLETLFVQSRRFTVLGRQDAEAILSEKKLILRESADLDEYAKIGATLGTDYLLCGQIKSIVVAKGQSQNMFTDATKPRLFRAFAIVDYRILVMPTGQIKWSGEATVDLDRAQLNALKGNEGAALSALIDLAAREICSQALCNIYPVRVVKVKDDGELILGEGGEMRREGELLDAYALGELLVDPYSKESLGREEKLIATLQVIRVEAKLSYATIVNGEISKELVEANRVLCRPSRAVIVTEKPAVESSIKPPTATEGVRLPFDK